MANGEKATVTVYTNPNTGAPTATGAGWNYNPGQVGYSPNLAKYDQDIRKLG